MSGLYILVNENVNDSRRVLGMTASGVPHLTIGYSGKAIPAGTLETLAVESTPLFDGRTMRLTAAKISQFTQQNGMERFDVLLCPEPEQKRDDDIRHMRAQMAKEGEVICRDIHVTAMTCDSHEAAVRWRDQFEKQPQVDVTLSVTVTGDLKRVH